MTSSPRTEFLSALDEQWSPILRASGFAGDGERFQRHAGDVIHAIALQENKYGGSFCVNLAAHPAFLPLTAGGMPPPGAPVRAESCEFQWRLAPPGHADYWWACERGAAAHLPLPQLQEQNDDPRERALHLVKTYETVGEPAFHNLATLEQFANLITLADLDKQGRLAPQYSFTPARACLTMARIHRRLGNEAHAQTFAQTGLDRFNKARLIRAELEQFLAAK